MRPRLRTIWSAAVWGMIPLAVLSGQPAARCVCADGHFELFCGRLATQTASASGSRTASEKATCKHCQAKPPASDADLPLGDHCQEVGKDLATMPSLVAAPVSPVAIASAPLVAAQDPISAIPCVAILEHLDTGPPLDRVIALRTLRI